MSLSSNRIERLRHVLKQIGADAMYVRDTPNIQWLCAFDDVFDEEDAHALYVPVEGVVRLHTDSRYVTACLREAAGSSIEVDAETVRFPVWVHALAGDERLALEDSITLGEYQRLGAEYRHEDSMTSLPFVVTKDTIVTLRATKDEIELDRIRAAQAITDAAFDHICGFIAPGMTEREVQLELDTFMLRNGADALAFPTIVASGSNGASPHALVSDKVLERGECVVMDFGAKRAGYCSDMTRTVFLGQPDERMQAAWEALRAANETVERELCVGMSGKAAHERALEVLDAGAEPYAALMGHSLGHGVGLEIHELPVLSVRNEAPLEVGNVITVEPGIYIPGVFGMRLEDMGVITNDGFKRFTASTHEQVIL